MGFNSGIIAGALLYLKADFPDIVSDPTMKGLVTASVFATAFAANACVAFLVDRLGRALILRLMNIPFIIGALVSAFAQSSTHILIGRLISGFAVGIAGTVPNLYIAEIVPAEGRGRHVGMAPLYGTTGIMMSQLFAWIIAEALGHDLSNEIGWRIMFGLGALPAVAQLFWLIGIPESPRWCRQKGLAFEAEQNSLYLISIGGSDNAAPQAMADDAEETLDFRQSAIAVGLSVMQQLSGVNAVIYYAPTLFMELGVQANNAVLIAGLNSVAQVGMTRIMTLIVDKLGRRTVCQGGLAGMFFGLLAIGCAFVPSLNLPVGWAIAGMLIFRLSFSLSLGPLPFIMVTELFPQRQRARGVAVSMMANWGLNCAVVFAVPDLVATFRFGVFFCFAGICVLSSVIVDLWLPETSRQNLEDLANARQKNGVLRSIAKRITGKREPDRSGPLLLFDSNTTTATTSTISSFSCSAVTAESSSSSFSADDTHGENTNANHTEADKSATHSLQLESAMMKADKDDDDCSHI